MLQENIIIIIIGAYLAVINLLSIILTTYDKRAARRGSWRVKERTLLLVSLIGGSIAMLAIMRLIRHKTKRFKFMLGIPVIIILQVAVIILIIWHLKLVT